MIRICSYCAKEGRPCVLGEKAPFHDLSVTHGCCEACEQGLLAELATVLTEEVSYDAQ